MKKIVAFTGSGRKEGNTSTIVNEVLKGAAEFNAQIKIYNIKDMDIKPCRGCFYCRKFEQCCIKDDMNEVLNDIKEADAVVFSSPIYMCQVSGQVKQLMDRLYPLLSGESGNYELRYGVKETVAIYSQGAPNVDSFKEYIELNNRVLSFLGLNIINTIICSGANDLKAVLENKELLSKAYAIGKELSM
ncbi:flavodoxin family protein [Clostridium sp. WILCCON 0269]|uniref:Flavodoxin family protein n=1 Tax=Candidatus Clostridium eludens TaxID=3381663 RepID=A0ABW8SRD3_9CLOT